MDARQELRSDVVAESEVSTAPKRKPMSWGRKRKLLGVFSIVAGLVTWQVVAMLELVNPLFFPKLTAVGDRLWQLATTGELANHAWATVSTFLLGLVIAVTIGMVLGILLASSRVVDALLWPWVMALNSVPRIALIPIVILFFGIGMSARTTVVVLTAVFPIIVNVAAGLRNVDAELLEMGRSFGASRTSRFVSIQLPASVPFLLAGFRISVALGLIGVVVAEFFASNEGLGYLLFRASALFDVPTVYSMMVLLGITGVLLSEGAKWLEARFQGWRTQ